MQILKSPESGRLSQALLRLYARGPSSAFATNVAAMLRQLFPDSIATVDELIYEPLAFASHASDGFVPQESSFFPAIVEYADQNPISCYVLGRGQEPIVQLTDFLSFRQFRRLAVYQEGYRHLDYRDQLMINLPSGQSSMMVGLTGTRPYTADDRALLAFLRPHILQAKSNAGWVSAAERPLAGPDPHLLQLTVPRDDAITHWPPEMRQILDHFYGASRQPWAPPPDLVSWIKDRRRDFAEGRVPWRRARPLQLQRGPHKLVITLARTIDGEREILAFTGFLGGIVRAPKDLTAREKDVLHWIGQGKTNAEIGIILGISPHTVKKHVEHLLAKHGVENRVALATGISART